MATSDGGKVWTATLTPTADVTDSTNVITVNLARLTDSAGNAGTGNQSSENYSVSTVRPTVTIGISPTALRADDTAVVTFTFSEAVIGFTSTDITAPNGAISNLFTTDNIVWTATFTPDLNVDDNSNLISVDMSGVTSTATDNPGTGTTDSGNYVLSTKRPTVTILVADTSLKAGETSLVTFTFSESVTGFTNADLLISGGTLSDVATSDGGTIWTATLTPDSDITDTTNVIRLDNTGVRDQTTNSGTGTTNSNNYAIDTMRPTATIVLTDTSLAKGETTVVTITFSEAVTDFTKVDLTVANAVSSADGGITWTATLTPREWIDDTTNIITLDNTGYTNIGGNTGTGTTDSNNYAIDTVLPDAMVDFAEMLLLAGQTSLVTITFTEPVTDFTNDDLTFYSFADVTPEVGTLTPFTSEDGGITWTATFTPAPNFTNTWTYLSVDTSLVHDLAGNPGVMTAGGVDFHIDTIRPTATISVEDSSLRIGDTTLVTITFSEAVTDFTNADLTVENGTLTDVTSNDGGVTWTATLTPAADVEDSTNLITLDNTGVKDTDGNSGEGTTDSNNYEIDTLPPNASIVLGQTTLRTGGSTQVTILFNEPVSGFSNSNLIVRNGTLSIVSSSDGGKTWTGTLTPTADVTDPTNTITLDNTGVTDAAGNAGTGTSDSDNYVVDTQPPTAAIVVADAELTTGETSLVTITFSEAVTDFTDDDLVVQGGTLSAVSSSDGGITWTATLTPTAHITDTTNVITLDVSDVTDFAGNPGEGTATSNNYAIDTNDAPTDISLNGTVVDGMGASVVVEGLADDTVIGTFSAIDPDDDSVVYTLIDDAGGRFAVVGADLVVADSAALDFETGTSHTIRVQVSDGNGNTSEKTFTIRITPTNDNTPVFTSSSTFNVAENSTAVGTVVAIDADLPAQTVTYSITGGADQAKFSITEEGVLTFLVAPDFDNPTDDGSDNHYLVRVTANDGNGGTTSQDIEVTVTAENDNSPFFTSPIEFDVNENTASVGTVTATDGDMPADTITYSITGGADSDKFTITPQGVLSFVTAPDFDSPTDAGSNNAYQVTITANDGHGGTTTQSISVYIVGLNDNTPHFVDASPTFSIAENLPIETIVGTVSATDADLPAQGLTYSIISGNELGAFAINPNTGEITVADPSQLDFETNPSFSLTIRVTDNGSPEARTADAEVQINLVDIAEGPVITVPDEGAAYFAGKRNAFVAPQMEFTSGSDAEPDYTGAKLTAKIISGRGRRDVLTVASDRNGSSGITLRGRRLFYQGTNVGTIKPGGRRGTPDLEITFNSNATTEAVQRTMRRITFFTTTDVGTSRMVEFHLSGEGVESNTATREISVIEPGA